MIVWGVLTDSWEKEKEKRKDNPIGIQISREQQGEIRKPS